LSAGKEGEGEGGEGVLERSAHVKVAHPFQLYFPAYTNSRGAIIVIFYVCVVYSNKPTSYY
jgi:hypothetical protein